MASSKSIARPVQVNGNSYATPNQTGYGPVLDIVTLKTMKMRGQAHIVFRDVQASTNALRALQGVEILGKEMRISYARGKSHVISKLDGTARSASQPDTAKQPPGAQATDLQKSIFNHATTNAASKAQEANTKQEQGLKRTRDEVDSEAEKSADDDDEGEAMEESSDDDDD